MVLLTGCGQVNEDHLCDDIEFPGPLNDDTEGSNSDQVGF